MKGGKNNMLGKKKSNIKDIDRISAEVIGEEDEEDYEEEVSKPKLQKSAYMKRVQETRDSWSVVEVPTQSVNYIRNNKTGKNLDIYAAIVEILNRTEE
jgi:hypothetical protein